MKGGEGLNAVVAYLEDGRLADPWWREPILLLAGYMGANAARNAREFLRKLAGAGRGPGAQLAAAELAAMGALEWKESGDDLRREIALRIGGLYDDTELMGQAAPIGRARAGQALARLGDPREHVMRVDAMRLCWVPSGRFFMGSALDDEQAHDYEKPPQPDFLVEYDYAIGQHRSRRRSSPSSPAAAATRSQPGGARR